MSGEFFFVDEVVPDIRWDAKYATADNFTGRPVEGYGINRIVAAKAMCVALAEARAAAAAHGFGLLLWDGYRPQRAVDSFLRWSQQPETGQTKLRHYPNIDRAEMIKKGYVAARSGHSRGGSVDLTLFDLATGELAAMGGDHDLMDPISHHGAQGITPIEAEHRRCLRTVMEASGFHAYRCEWWHYTLNAEPYPNTYFDFPISGALLDV